MNNKVGKEIVLNGVHLGKVLAEPTEGSCKGFYLVLLSEEGIKRKKGWTLNRTDSERLKNFVVNMVITKKIDFIFSVKIGHFSFLKEQPKY